MQIKKWFLEKSLETQTLCLHLLIEHNITKHACKTTVITNKICLEDNIYLIWVTSDEKQKFWSVEQELF